MYVLQITITIIQNVPAPQYENQLEYISSTWNLKQKNEMVPRDQELLTPRCEISIKH